MFILIKIKKAINRSFCIFGLHEFRPSYTFEFCAPTTGSFVHNKSVLTECRFCNKTNQKNYVDGKLV